MIRKLMEARENQLIRNTLENSNHPTLMVDSAMKTEDKAKEFYITRKLLRIFLMMYRLILKQSNKHCGYLPNHLLFL